MRFPTTDCDRLAAHLPGRSHRCWPARNARRTNARFPATRARGHTNARGGDCTLPSPGRAWAGAHGHSAALCTGAAGRRHKERLMTRQHSSRHGASALAAAALAATLAAGPGRAGHPHQRARQRPRPPLWLGRPRRRRPPRDGGQGLPARCNARVSRRQLSRRALLQCRDRRRASTNLDRTPILVLIAYTASDTQPVASTHALSRELHGLLVFTALLCLKLRNPIPFNVYACGSCSVASM